MASDWTSPSDDADAERFEAKIHALREEHRALDGAIQASPSGTLRWPSTPKMGWKRIACQRRTAMGWT